MKLKKLLTVIASLLVIALCIPTLASCDVAGLADVFGGVADDLGAIGGLLGGDFLDETTDPDNNRFPGVSEPIPCILRNPRIFLQ